VAHTNAHPGAGDSGARQGFQSGLIDPAANTENRHPAQVIRDELVGRDRASACGITVRGQAPVLTLCRALLRAGFDPDRPLRAYRGPILCLAVTSIGAAARLTVEECGDGCPRFRRHRPQPSEVTPPVRQNRSAGAHDRAAALARICEASP
jgi:hypothetical protein